MRHSLALQKVCFLVFTICLNSVPFFVDALKRPSTGRFYQCTNSKPLSSKRFIKLGLCLLPTTYTILLFFSSNSFSTINPSLKPYNRWCTILRLVLPHLYLSSKEVSQSHVSKVTLLMQKHFRLSLKKKPN